MNRRLLTILLSAFVIAAVCAFLVYRVVGNSMANATHQSATTKVVAAAADLKLGTLLTAANLTTVEIAGPLPKGRDSEAGAGGWPRRDRGYLPG
jgi:pilus assembly protein CpaB